MGLLEELTTLRKGRGLNSVGIQREVGPTLRALCGIVSDDQQGTVRRKLGRQLDQWAGRLPPDLGLAARAALALHPEAQQRFLTERTHWLAQRIDRDGRTARRRMDEALRLMADLGGEQSFTAVGGEPPAEEHYIAEHWALVRLDQPTLETHERRVVVSNVDGLEEVDTVLSLPRDPLARPGAQQLHMEVLYGALLVDRIRETESRFRYKLRLPSPLKAGQSHEYSLLYRIPPKQFVRPHYVFVPHRRCDALTLRVRFGADRLPSDVRRVDYGFLRDLDDELVGDKITLDSAGELYLRFSSLVTGMAYGARWHVRPEQQEEYPTVPDA